MDLAHENRTAERRRREVEKALARTFVRFESCHGGNQSTNFKAETDEGAAYFVKFASPSAVARLCALHAGIDVPIVPSPVCHGDDWIVFPWRKGRNVHPADMTDGQLRSIVRTAAHFNEASNGFKHGDFHSRNFLFEGDEVTTVCDLECMRLGAPVDDVLRVFVHALERTRFWQRRRIRSILSKLSFCVANSPWTGEEWTMSFDRYQAHKLARRKEKKSGWTAAIDRWFRGGFYRRIREAIEAVAKPPFPFGRAALCRGRGRDGAHPSRGLATATIGRASTTEQR